MLLFGINKLRDYDELTNDTGRYANWINPDQDESTQIDLVIARMIVMISAMGVAGVAHTEHISDVITMEELFGG